MLESLSEHSATVHMNALFVFTLAVWTLKCRAWLRWVMLALCVPVVYAYLLSQRRAAMVALFVGIIVLLVVLFYCRRRVFWFFSVTMSVLGSGFVLATWNATGALGLPATAVKTVLFPDQLQRGRSRAPTSTGRSRRSTCGSRSSRARSPASASVRSSCMPLPLPDISFFEFWEYLPHNSVLWIWLKMGFLGFVAMLFLFARAVQLGARSALVVRTQEQVAIGRHGRHVRRDVHRLRLRRHRLGRPQHRVPGRSPSPSALTSSGPTTSRARRRRRPPAQLESVH